MLMRTTIDIDEQLLLYAKQKAAEQRVSLKSIMEDSLRDFFSRQVVDKDFIKLETFTGAGTKPGVDLCNNRSLVDIMDDL